MVYKGLLLVAVAVSSAACGGQPEQVDGTVGVADEALSDSCGNGGNDGSFSGFIDPGVTSPQTYNRCTKSYVVDVNNLSPEYADPGDGTGGPSRFQVAWGDTYTNTEAGCNNLSGAAIIFLKSGNSWVDISGGQISAYGNWIDGGGIAFCDTPQIEFFNIVAGQSYRIAATMRLNSGSNPTRKVQVTTKKAYFVH